MADTISTLPDAILCHILSFLQTKQSVATTVLSKRWNNLWRYVPVLLLKSIYVTDQNSYIRFIDFVYSVLLSRDPTLLIKKFKLSFHFSNYQILDTHRPIDTITKWVNFVVTHGVEYFDLYVSYVYLPELPISILTCRTLVVLKLLCFSVVDVTSPVSLPSLKTLRLNSIRFSEQRDFMLLLAGCPILEDLFTFDVSFEFDSDESLTCDEWNSFRLSKLAVADIDCLRNYFPLRVVYNVSSLHLEIDQVNCRNNFIQTFHNLTQLKFGCVSINYSSKFIVEVLKHCPKLQKLHLDEVHLDEEFWPRNDDDENWVDPDFVPQCLPLHLRTCYFGCFSGLNGELMLAMYILKNARVLQSMKIWNFGQPIIERQLSSCPRASETCKLTVCYVTYVPGD